VLATVVALGLNLLFRIGIKRSVEMELNPATLALQEVENFVERNAGGWGARRDVIGRVKFTLMQAGETVAGLGDRGQPIRLTMTYDEFDIEARLAYRGAALELHERAPSADEIIEEGGDRALAGFLIGRQADQAKSITKDGLCVLQLHFRQ